MQNKHERMSFDPGLNIERIPPHTHKLLYVEFMRGSAGTPAIITGKLMSH